MNSDIQSQLAPPGAGIPVMERIVGGLLFRIRRATASRESIIRRFGDERAAIRALIESVPESRRGTRVLIKRPRGLEDSSRYWSVWMTLDHLRIVHGEITGIIAALSRGERPKREANTAAVKPGVNADASVVGAYERSCDELLEAARTVPDMKTAARFPHPWFGPLDAAGWHTLAAGHMGIHRLQLSRICSGLPRRA